MTTRSAPRLALLAVAASLCLAACGSKDADQAAVPPVAGNSTEAAAAGAAAAIDTAEAPAAGTSAANVATATDPGPPPANIADIRDAAGDEAPREAKAKVANAAAAGRIIPPKPAQ